MPRGQTEHLKKSQYKLKGDRPLAKVPLSVRLPEDIDEYVRSLPDRSKWLQQVIVDKVIEEFSNKSTNQKSA